MLTCISLKLVKSLSASLFLICLALKGGLEAASDSSAASTFTQGPDFISVAKKAIPSIVSIQVKGSRPSEHSDADDFSHFFNDDFFQRFFSTPRRFKEGQKWPSFEGQASGFIVSEDGYILTNSHVVQNASELKVILQDRREFAGKVVGSDPNTDIAVVKIEAKELPFLTLGNSDQLQIGQWVVAIGNPFGLQASLTTGVVSATGRNNLELTTIEDFIQTDAAINQGNSGGALLNLASEVVGITNAIVTNGHAGGYAGIGFAIPSNMARRIMEQLISTGSVTRGFIGVSLQTVDQDLAKAFGLSQPSGALVTEVSKDSPAEKSGIKQGDIIQAYNKQPIYNIASLRNAISMMEPGSKMSLTLLREGKTIEIPIEIGSFPGGLVAKTEQSLGVKNKWGFEVENLTPEMSQNLGIKENKGVVITKIDADSLAAWAGLKKGAVIIAVNQQPITSVEQFLQTIQESPPHKPILLLVRQDKNLRFLSLGDSVP